MLNDFDMGSKTALISLKSEFQKINLQDGSVEGEIDLKIIESNLRILAFETDRSCIDRDGFLSIVPAILLCLSSKNKALRSVVNKFLSNIKDLIAWMKYKQNDWVATVSVDFLSLCVERLGAVVNEFSDDWIEPWLMLVSISFADDDGGLCSARLNLLLSVVERAFKCAKVKRVSAKTTFHAWERFNTILSESLSFSKIINTAKVLHLLILPFVCIKIRTADPYKHRAWFHVIEKFGVHSEMARLKVVEPFLQFLMENRVIFIQYNEDIVSYVKKLCNHDEVASKYCSQLLNCIDLCIEHNSKMDDVIAAWTSLCDHVIMDHEHFKKLLNFLKTRPDQGEQNELLVNLCLVSYRHKLFDFKSLLFEDIRSTIEEVFPLVMTSLEFRETVFHKILCEMMELTWTLKQKMTEDEEEGCMDPILSMWEVLVLVYTDFVDGSIDSGFIPADVDFNIISDLLILGLSQPLTEVGSNEDTALSIKLKAFLLHLRKKSKSELFSSDFLSKLDTDIKLSHISLKNCLWLASLALNFKPAVNLLPLLSILCKSITGYGQPKLILEFLGILDLATEKVGLKVSFKPSLNYLRKFSSSYEPPYDLQIRQLAHNLLKRVPELSENKTNSNNTSEVEEKKCNVRSPLTVHSNFLSRLSKAEEKKNNKNMFAASIFARGDSEKTDLNKENKQSIDISDSGKPKPLRPDDIHLSPVSDRFAKSNAFVLDNSESSEPMQSSNDVIETKMANYKISTDLHKNVSATGLSPKSSNSVSQTKEINQREATLRSVVSPQSDKTPNSKVLSSPSTPRSSGKGANKNKYSFLDSSSLDNQDFVFVPPKTKSKDSPLTTHQKEMLNKRREEIPALYQDLSQNTTSDLSSQDSSLLCLESKWENTAVPDSAANSHKNDEAIKSVHDEENAVCEGFNSEASNKDDRETPNGVGEVEDMPDITSLSPRRLNFEGVCSNNESKPSTAPALTPTRRLGRKSTSKYRKSLDNDTNDVSKKPEVKQTSSALDSCVTEASQKNEIAPEKPVLVTSGKRRGRRPKSANIKSNEISEPEGPNLKPKVLKGKLASDAVKTKDQENVCVSTITDAVNSNICSELSLLENSEHTVETVSVANSNNNERIPSGLNNTPDSGDKFNTSANQEPMDMNNSLTPPSSNSVNVTPEKTSDISTPKRRKRSKSSIKFNEFSPKMLRKGRTSIKISPKNKVLKKIVKSINDDIQNDEAPTINIPVKEVGDVVKAPVFVIEVSSVTQKLPMENIQVDATSSTCSEVTRDGDMTTESPEDRVEDCQTPSVISDQSKLVQKTSPNRAMRIMEMLNANDPTLSKSCEIKLPSSANGKSQVNEVKSKNKLVKSKGNLSRASRILKLAKNKSNLDHSELEPMSVSDAEQADSLTSPENSEQITDPSHPISRGKRKSISRIPVSEKKAKMDVLNSPVSDVALTPKGKISSLDGWIIKKDKNSKLDSIAIDLSTDLLDTRSQTVKDTGKTSTDNKVNEKSVSILSVTGNQMESQNTVEVEIIPNDQLKESPSGADPNSPRWPKRSRKSVHLNIGRRPQNTDNKATPPRRKQKPQKQQNDLSPSKVYSYDNWPKGDCETWVACEPTPPSASPSVAILKQRSAYASPPKSQISPNVTPKKRVSFLDPVVSKGLLYHKDELGGKLQHAVGERGTLTGVRKRNIKLKYNYDNESSQPTDDSRSVETSQQDLSKTSQVTDEAVLTQSNVVPLAVAEVLTSEDITLEIIDKSHDEILIESENTDKDDSIAASICMETTEDMNATVDNTIEINVEMDAAKQQEETPSLADKNEEPERGEVPETLDDEVADQITTPLFETEFESPLSTDNRESPEFFDDSQCIADAVDIVEKVVGQVDKNQVVIVEKVEVCEGTDAVLSDESLSVQDQDEEMSIDDTSEIVDVKTESFVNTSDIQQDKQPTEPLPAEVETLNPVQSEQLNEDLSDNSDVGDKLLNENMQYFNDIQIVKQEMSPSLDPHDEINSLHEQYECSSDNLDQANVSTSKIQLSQEVNSRNSNSRDLRPEERLAYETIVKTENSHSQTETVEETDDIPSRCRQINDWLDSISDIELSRADVQLLFSTLMSAAHRVFSFPTRLND